MEKFKEGLYVGGTAYSEMGVVRVHYLYIAGKWYRQKGDGVWMEVEKPERMYAGFSKDDPGCFETYVGPGLINEDDFICPLRGETLTSLIAEVSRDYLRRVHDESHKAALVRLRDELRRRKG